MIPSHICALKENGEAWTWGRNAYGQLGDGADSNVSSPVLVVGDHSFIQASVGKYHSFALKENGEAWGWGDNGVGELGNNTVDDKSSPVSVVGDHSFTYVDASCDENTAALKENGEVWCWGDNGVGELGDNTEDDKSSPVSVVGEHSFVHVRGVVNGVAALKGNGECWCWGRGGDYQLGNGSLGDKSSPVSVIGEHSFVQLIGGKNYVCALKESGEIWGWGKDNYGQLGNNVSLIDKTSPVSVVGNHSFIQVTAGFYFTCALKANGEVWSWGYNGYGQLGNNTTDSKSSPVLVVGDHSFVQIACGLHHTCALKENGEIWTWGYNSYGNLGDNTRDNRSSPVSIVGNHSFSLLVSNEPSEGGVVIFIGVGTTSSLSAGII